MALEILVAALREGRQDLKLNERYHQLLFALNERAECLNHLPHYLSLASRLNPQLAASAFLNARQLQADYLPEDPSVCERIAEVLIERHKAREGLSLLRNLHKRYPDYPGIPRAYLMAARAFSEELGQVEPAQQLLAFIRQRYPASSRWARWCSLRPCWRSWAGAQVPDRATCMERSGRLCKLQAVAVWAYLLSC